MSVVILTMGDRARELERLVASVRQQGGVRCEVVVVLNGGPKVSDGCPTELGDRLVVSPENIGIPGGRNLGAGEAANEYLCFLDDDGYLPTRDAISIAVCRLVSSPDVAAVGMRIEDEHGATSRRHVPRLGRSGMSVPGEVTAFLGGAVIMRASAFEEVGGYDEAFFYAMEETDLAWRLAAANWRMWYEPRARLRHPRVDPSRHPDYLVRTASNRFVAAYRSLPAPLALVYLLNWFLIASLRSRRLAPHVSGYVQGWQRRPVRRPMSWRTVGRLAKLGRPPVV